MDEAKRQARHDRWEALGVERVKNDLLNGGHQEVGGTPEVREAAWEWVKAKEAASKEVVTLKPTLWGMGVDLKAAWKRIRDRWGTK